MKRPPDGAREMDTGMPFGSDPKRSKVPLTFFATLYALWFGALVWMAINQYGHR